MLLVWMFAWSVSAMEPAPAQGGAPQIERSPVEQASVCERLAASRAAVAALKGVRRTI